MKLFSFGEILWDIFDTRKAIGGAPLNFAAYASMLGAGSYLVSAVGNDELGKEALSIVESYGISTDYTSVLGDKPTGSCIVTLDEKGIPSYNLLYDVAYDYIKPCSGVSADVFAFGSLALRMENNRQTIRKILAENDFSEVFADVNIRPPHFSDESIEICLKNATIVKISDEELPVVCQYVCGENKSISEILPIFSEKYPQMKLIIITKGDKGSCCYKCKEKTLYECDAQKTEVVSTVGAGDSFGASFLVKYLESGDCQAALEFASKISAKVCAFEGAILPKLPNE